MDEVRKHPDWETKFEEYHRQCARDSNNQPKGATPPPGTFSKKVSAGAYNAMIAPLQPLRIRGVIWYQGETNASRSPRSRHSSADSHRSWLSRCWLPSAL